MIKRLLAVLILAVSLTAPLTVLAPAQTHAATASNCRTEGVNFLGFPTWYKFLDPQFSNGECELRYVEQKGLIASAPRILLAVFEIILRITGLAAVGFVVYGGFRYVLSQGEPDATKASKGTIITALIGLAIALSATAIVNLIGNSIT